MKTPIVLMAALACVMLLPVLAVAQDARDANAAATTQDSQDANAAATTQDSQDANAAATTQPSFGPPTSWSLLSQIGAALALGMAAFGSAVGIGKAGQAASGAWAKEAKEGRSLTFTYIILLGLPLSQTLYGMIVMDSMGTLLEKAPQLALVNVGLMLGVGIATGIAEMLSAWMQGLIGAAGIRAISEGQKGFPFIIIAMGIVETVGIFAMVFLLGLLPEVPG